MAREGYPRYSPGCAYPRTFTRLRCRNHPPPSGCLTRAGTLAVWLVGRAGNLTQETVQWERSPLDLCRRAGIALRDENQNDRFRFTRVSFQLPPLISYQAQKGAAPGWCNKHKKCDHYNNVEGGRRVYTLIHTSRSGSGPGPPMSPFAKAKPKGCDGHRRIRA